MSIKGKTAIITGATRGIGRAIALKFAQEGFNVAFTYLSNEDLAKSLTKEIKKMKVSVVPFKVDTRSFEQVKKMKDEILSKFGTIDVLINNAGIVKDVSLAMMSEKDWDDVLDTNLKGTFNITKAFIFTFMKQRYGHIINISSLSGVIGMSGQTNYSASKGGVISFTKALAKEVAPFNVNVNAIAPGFIETDMVKGLNENFKKKMLEHIPLKRFGTAEEVAELAFLLLNAKLTYVTGQVIQIDGGLGI